MRLEMYLSPRWLTANATVFLDGAQVDRCVMADEEEGVVEVLEITPSPAEYSEPRREPSIRRVRKAGQVRIDLPPSIDPRRQPGGGS